MKHITKFIFLVSLFFSLNSLVDFYFDKPLNHASNILIALAVASVLAYLDYRDWKREQEDD